MMLGMDMMGGGRRLPRNGLLLYLARPNSDEYLVGEDTEIGEDTYIWGYVLPDDADIRAATGWVNGTANVFYGADGTPIVTLATEIAAAIDHLPLEVVFSLVSATTQTGRLAIYAPGTSDTVLARAYEVLRYDLALPSSGLLLHAGTTPENIGAATVLRSTLPLNANPTVQQVKGSGFAGAGSATVAGLLTTDTITATGDAPTCTVDGVLTFPGSDCWDVYVHRGGVLWAYWPGINVGGVTELDASGNGHNLDTLMTTTITERVDGSGTNYANIYGFAELENLQRYTWYWPWLFNVEYESGGVTTSENHRVVSSVATTGRTFITTDSKYLALSSSTPYTAAIYVDSVENSGNSHSHYQFLNLGITLIGKLSQGWNIINFTTGTVSDMQNVRLGASVGATSSGPCSIAISKFAVFTGTQLDASRYVDAYETAQSLVKSPILLSSASDIGTIVCLGDSMTSNDYPYNLKALCPNIQVIDSGIGGHTLSDMLLRFESDVVTYSPDYMFLLGGTNDIFANASAATIKTRIQEIVALCESNDIIPVLATIAPSSVFTVPQKAVLEEVNAWLLQYASDNNYSIADVNAVLNDGNGAIWSAYDGGDQIHPNRVGYDIVARSFLAVLPTTSAYTPKVSVIGGEFMVAGPLRADLTVTAGTTYPALTVTAPLGPEFQAITEWTGGATVDLSTLTPTANTRTGQLGVAVWNPGLDASEIVRADKVLGA